MLNREQVPVEATWDVSRLYPSDEAWERDIEQLLSDLPHLETWRGRLGESPSALVDALQLSEQISLRSRRVTLYAHMHYVVDTVNPQGLARRERSRGIAARVSAACAFIRPEIIAIGFDTLRQWMQQEPRLAIYAHYFDRLQREAAHVRSAEVEELLGALSEPFSGASGAHDVLCNAELRFGAVDHAEQSLEITHGTIDKLLRHPDRNVRRAAYDKYTLPFLEHKNTFATCVATGVRQAIFTARARRYPSTFEMRLAQNHIPRAVFDTLIATFRRHLPTWHRYWDVRRRFLGLDELQVYDIRAPLSARPPTIGYQQAAEWIAQGMAPLGEEYVSILRQATGPGRWVDWAVNRGKRVGAFSTNCPGVGSFVFMSFNGDLFGLSTLAHELGHAMHSYFTNSTQPLVYANYSLFVAEVASNFNQAMTRAYLMESNSDPDFQLAVIEEAMANFHRYFFIMPTLARFEQEIHARGERGQPLTAPVMMQLMADLFEEGYGGKVAVDRDRVGITFAQFPNHLYSHFYVYQYATGISGAHALAQRVRTGGKRAAEEYLAFLKAGNSLYPLDALKLAGVDLTSPEPIEQTFAVLAGLVDRLEGLLGKTHSASTRER